MVHCKLITLGMDTEVTVVTTLSIVCNAHIVYETSFSKNVDKHSCSLDCDLYSNHKYLSKHRLKFSNEKPHLNADKMWQKN